MTEHSAPFTDEMVRAILAGIKTETRRLVKLPRWGSGEIELDDDNKPLAICTKTGCLAEILNPYGIDGDTIWCREAHTWITLADEDEWRERAIAEGRLRRHFDGYDVAMFWRATDQNVETRWRPSMFMFRWASRILLENTGSRVEHLHEITHEDAMAEGVVDYLFGEYDDNGFDDYPCYSYAIRNYRRLWDKINLKSGHGWDTNPLVRVTQFKIKEVTSDLQRAGLR